MNLLQVYCIVLCTFCVLATDSESSKDHRPSLGNYQGLWDSGDVLVDSYETTVLRFADPADNREILARFADYNGRPNWYRPAPSYRFRTTAKSRKPQLDEKWLLTAIENFVPSGLVTSADEPSKNSSASEEFSSSTDASTTTTTTTERSAVSANAGNPIIWIFTTTMKPPTTPDPWPSMESTAPTTTSTTTTTTPTTTTTTRTTTTPTTTTTTPPTTTTTTPRTTTTTSTTVTTTTTVTSLPSSSTIGVQQFTRPFVRSTTFPTTTTTASATPSTTPARATTKAWWLPNPSYQFTEIPQSDSEIFYDYGDSPLSLLQQEQQQQQPSQDSNPSNPQFASLSSAFSSIPRPIRNITALTTPKISRTTATTTATADTTTTSTTSQRPTRTRPSTLRTLPTSRTTATAPTTTTPTTLLPPLIIPDETSDDTSENLNSEDQETDRDYDTHFVVVNVWNYIGGKLTLMGQQKIPSEMFENMNISNGDTMHSSQVPSSVVQLLTNNISIDPSGNFQMPQINNQTETPSPVTETPSTTTRKPYGGVGNHDLQGIVNFQIRNRTAVQINREPKPNPYQQLTTEHLHSYPTRTSSARPPFFKTTKTPVRTPSPPVVGYHNPPLEAILPDYIVEALGRPPVHDTADDSVYAYPEAPKKPFATLPYTRPSNSVSSGVGSISVAAPEPPRVDTGIRGSLQPVVNSSTTTSANRTSTSAQSTSSSSGGGRNALMALGLSMLPTMAIAFPLVAPLLGRKRRSLRSEETEYLDRVLESLQRATRRRGRQLVTKNCKKFTFQLEKRNRHFLLCTNATPFSMEMVLLDS